VLEEVEIKVAIEQVSEVKHDVQKVKYAGSNNAHKSRPLPVDLVLEKIEIKVAVEPLFERRRRLVPLH
jgi:hypothetical protein